MWSFIVHIILSDCANWWVKRYICTKSNDLTIVHATISCLLLFIYFCKKNEHENQTETRQIESIRIEPVWMMHTFICTDSTDGGNHVVNLICKLLNITHFNWFDLLKLHTPRRGRGGRGKRLEQKIQRRVETFQVTSFNFNWNSLMCFQTKTTETILDQRQWVWL